MTERLISCAIIRGDAIESRGFKEHWKIRAALGDADPYKTTMGDQEGFLTNEGAFVTRSAAVTIGVKSGQLSPMWKSASRRLLSSDINW